MELSDFMGPIGSFVGQGVNAISTAVTNKRNRQFQRDMWDRTNLYNSPMEQRKRMEAAGFNPNMMYGHGTVANTASPVNVPDAIAPKFDVSSVTDELIKYQNLRNMKATEKQIDSQTALNEQARQKSILDQMASDTNRRFTQQQMDRFGDITPFAVEGAELGNKKLASEIELLDFDKYLKGETQVNMAKQGRLLDLEIAKNLFLNSNLPRRTALELGTLAANIGLTDANAARTLLMNQYVPQDKLYEYTQILQNIDFKALQSKGVRHDNEIKRIEAKYRDLGIGLDNAQKLMKTILPILMIL